jgi:hypothetical protein
MADATGTPGAVVSDEDYRINQAGLVSPLTSTLAVRTGVMIAPGSTALVTGTSATGTMTVNVAAHHWVTSRATADGIYLGTKEAAGTVNIAAAPGSNSRIDVVYSKQNDAGSTVSPDGSTAELYGVVTGTAAASPTKPAIPTGAVELATVQIASGTTSTNGAGSTITNTAAQVSARGAKVWVRNATERAALTQFAGLEVHRIDTGKVEISNGTAWATLYDPALPPASNNGGTTSVLAGTAPPAGTPLLTKTVYTTVTTSVNGDATVSFPSAFANGLTALSVTHISLGGVPSNNIEFVPWSPTLSNTNVRCYFGTAVLASTPGVAISIIAVGW